MQYSSLATLLILSLLASFPIVSPQASAQAAADGDWKTASVRDATSPSGGDNATIRYKLSGGEIERNVVTAYPPFQTLAINIVSDSSGTLILELPRSVIDSKMSDNVTDAPLTAFFRQGTDITPATIRELNNTADMRVVSIDFPVLESDSTYNIGIQGTYVIPEFGAIAPIALGLSLVSALLLTTRFRLFSSGAANT
ncbi:MAG TPA: hypothetical protein VF172_11040 [Nitrososphaera sp.]|jgi:predicted secreted protein with PEFG-CTERM motif